MFRFFLSWRYLVARRTNIIGILGIFVGVAALILILSIMTGFLEESRRAVRGSLSDLLVQPRIEGPTGSPRGPEPLVHEISLHPEVAGATAQLYWAAILTQEGGFTEQIMASPTHSDLLLVQLVGIDVRTHLRLAWPLLRTAAAARGATVAPLKVHDEFDATDFLSALVRPGLENPDSGYAVRSPLFPFAAVSGPRNRGRKRASVVVGHQLATNLGLTRGTEIQIATVVRDPDTDEMIVNNRDYVVAGSFRSGENEADLGRIYLERDELADFLGDTQRFTQVLVRLDDYAGRGEAVRDELSAGLAAAGLLRGSDYASGEIRTWEEFRGNLLGAIENERVLMAIMLSLVLVVAGFTVFAILSMMVTEKRRDIGILCALGATPRGVLQLFLMIAFWDALVGALLGAFFGTWAALRIDSIERWLSQALGVEIFNRDVYLFDHIPSIVQPLWVATIVLGAFLCALLFAAIPAWRAARLHPLEALRYE